MAQALDERLPAVPRVVLSVLATVAVSALAAVVLVNRNAHDSGHGDDFRAAALVAALTALTSFVGAVVIMSLTRRLMPALWGYVPGLAGVLGAGLWLGEAARYGGSEGSTGTWWIGALVALNPLFWVPIGVGVFLAMRRSD